MFDPAYLRSLSAKEYERYYIYLVQHEDYVKPLLDQIIYKYGDVPSWGQCIVPRENLIPLVKAVNELGIWIDGRDFCCFCLPEREKRLGCPHGQGGPCSSLFSGSYSEIFCWVPYPVFDEDERPKIIEFAQKAFRQKMIDISPEQFLKVINLPELLFTTEERNHAYLIDTLYYLSFPDCPECITPDISFYLPKHWKHWLSDTKMPQWFKPEFKKLLSYYPNKTPEGMHDLVYLRRVGNFIDRYFKKLERLAQGE